MIIPVGIMIQVVTVIPVCTITAVVLILLIFKSCNGFKNFYPLSYSSIYNYLNNSSYCYNFHFKLPSIVPIIFLIEMIAWIATAGVIKSNEIIEIIVTIGIFQIIKQPKGSNKLKLFE